MRYSFLMDVLTSRYTYFFLIGVGVLFGIGFVYQEHTERTIRETYKTTTCKIVDSEVTVEEQVHRGGGRFGRFQRYSTYTFFPEITYEYEVNGEKFENDDYRHNEQGMTEAEAEQVVARYQPGQTAKCYYDPADPEVSVLTLESDTRGMYTMATIGLSLLVVGLGGWVLLDFILPAADNKPRRRMKELAPEPEVAGLKWLSEPPANNAPNALTTRKYFQ